MTLITIKVQRNVFREDLVAFLVREGFVHQGPDRIGHFDEYDRDGMTFCIPNKETYSDYPRRLQEVFLEMADWFGDTHEAFLAKVRAKNKEEAK